MNRLDSVISYFFPAAGYKRQAWRDALQERSNYDAADFGRRNRNWAAHNDSAQNMDSFERDIIRARGRDLERNSDVANSVLRAYERNVIGKGYALQAKTGDQEFDTNAEELWKEWCKAKNCDITGQQNFISILRMCLRRKKVDGGVILKKCYTPGGLIPFKLQVLEVDELDITQTKARHKGDRVIGGIEYNSFNKPVGYWIKQYSIDGMTYTEPYYTDAKDIIFYWEKHRPSQIREISDLTPTITRVRDVNEFVNAVSIKERVAACLAVFIKKIAPGGVIGRSSQAAMDDKISYEGKTLTPGMIGELNPGEGIETVNPGNSGANSAEILKIQQRMIGAGQGLSYETVSRDMSETNYSSARQASIEDESTFAAEKELIEEKILDEVYETFVISCILAKILPEKDFWKNKTTYMKHQWVAAPKKWIDPAKEATANKIALATGQKTFQDICAENGKDWQEQLDDISAAVEYAGNLGIELGGILYGDSWKKEQPENGKQE